MSFLSVKDLSGPSFNRFFCMMLNGPDENVQQGVEMILRSSLDKEHSWETVAEESFVKNSGTFLRKNLFQKEVLRFLWIKPVSGRYVSFWKNFPFSSLEAQGCKIILSGGHMRQSSAFVQLFVKNNSLGLIGCYESLQREVKEKLSKQFFQGKNLQKEVQDFLKEASLEDLLSFIQVLPLIEQSDGIDLSALKKFQRSSVPNQLKQESIFFRKKDSFLRFLDTIQDRASAIQFVRSSISFFEKMLEAKVLVNQGVSFHEACLKTGVLRFHAESKTLKIVWTLWDQERILRTLQALTSFEYSTKAGRAFFARKIASVL